MTLVHVENIPGRLAVESGGMINMSQALREEVAGLPAGDACCAAWELRMIGLVCGGAGPELLEQRLRTLESALAGQAGGPSGRAMKRCCRGAVLRGAVWKGAYVSADGHMEFCSSAKALELLQRTRVPFLAGRRNGRELLYLKDQETIAEVVGQMGAFQTMLELEDLLVQRRMRNDINRVVNCEVGNLARVTRSSLSTVEDIQLLEHTCGLEALPARLREVAALRLRHPTASLRELAQRARPALTKSGMQHRLDELGRLAAEIRRQQR